MTPIFYQCTVLDVQDPLMLGRVRARINIINYPDVLQSITSPKWNPEKDIWTERDPLVFYPLLPYFVYQVPKVGELIQVIFVNSEFKYQNQYYVQSNFFSVNSAFNTVNSGGAKFTGTGMQFKAPRNIKNQNGTWPAKSVEKGIYPEPGDNAILGRGSADLVIKETDVLLRAGKFEQKPQSNLQNPPNNNRAFLQLSIFDRTKVSEEIQKVVTSIPITLGVKYLIEWVIDNPENQSNKFQGTIYLYSLKDSTITNTKNIQVSTKIPIENKFLVYSEDFSLLSKEEVVAKVNQFIRECNDSNVLKNGRRVFSDSQDKFPLYFRIGELNYAQLTNTSPSDLIDEQAQDNLSFINSKIKFNPSDELGTSDSQFGLIWKKDTTGLPSKIDVQNVKNTNYEYKPTTVAALGAQMIYLLSQNSSIDGKGTINFANSIYGIPESAFTEDIQTKTSSLVRGEELLELINLIYQFLISHTHAYPGLSPVSVTKTNISIESLSTAMQNAKNKILNTNIRLN